jgi:DnaJ family protein C protein 17
VRWKAKKNDVSNGGYSHLVLSTLFQKYGDVEVLVSAKKKGSAIAAFSDVQSARLAIQNETGLSENQLTLSWADKAKGTETEDYSKNQEPAVETEDTCTSSTSTASDNLVSERDYESLVLTRLRQAEERKKLIEQLKAEDNSQSY